MRRLLNSEKVQSLASDPMLSESLYHEGANYRLQKVPEAWEFLALKFGIDLAFGSPNVCVATLDNGVDPRHIDVRGTLSDGSPRLIFTYDFEFGRECTTPAYLRKLEEDEEKDKDVHPGAHGMAVYGIIAAANESASGVVGIAKNTQQIAIRSPSPSTSPTYQETYLWVAGLRRDLPQGSPTPKNSLPRPADIICICQETFDDFPDSIIDQLTKEGRNGNGTVIICAAGNTGKQVSGIASNSNVITVGNTLPSKDGIEVRDKRSCIGAGLDLCAQGEEVMSLTLQPSRIAHFAQTSAAAPMVAATAALMLSVNPRLTSKEVRDILRASATKRGLIDSEIPDIDKDPKKFAQRFGFGRLDVLDAVRTAHSTLSKREASSKKLVKRVSDKTKGSRLGYSKQRANI